MYCFFLKGVILLMILRAYISAVAVKRSSLRVHQRLLLHIMKCPPAFFDTTPLGRILNRFIGDMVLTSKFVMFYFILILFFY
jgi:ABC-type multidrug transport system fused ATPase/permease subunit